MLRYLVGTVVGAILVAFLNRHSTSPFVGRLDPLVDLGDSAFLGVGVLAALGFAFCYVASLPILVLHATRAHIRLGLLRAHWLLHGVTCALPIAAAVFAASRIISLRPALMFGIVVGAEVGLIVVALITRFGPIEEFYRGIAEARSQAEPRENARTTAGGEYIVSYRHLREHGNAAGIVLLEGLLAYLLLKVSSPIQAFVLAIAWLFPAVGTWLIATALESRLVSRPLE